MSYTSNMGVVIDELNVKLNGLKNQDALQREIAVSLATSNFSRIHNESKDVSGSGIKYKPSRKTPTLGAYSRAYAKKRASKRRQTSKVDLSFTGKLSKEFQAAAISGGWGVGFLTSYGSDLHGWLEDKFGNVWGITVSDKQAIERIISKEIKKKLG